MRRTPLLLALLALVFGLAACGDDDDSSETGGEAATIEIDGETGNYEGTEEATAQPVELEEDDYYFEPTVLTGEANQKVTLEITNEGDEEHNITIAEQDVDEDTEPGESTTVDAEIPNSGVIEFYCSYHTSENMRGALAVTGSEPTPSSEAETTSESSGGGY